MITLIGHGYVGEHIKQELENRGLDHCWISHREPIPQNTSVIINAAGYTGSPNVDACEIHKLETLNGNVMFPLKLELENPDIPVVHISSGCVYTGYEKEFTEQDPPNFDFTNGSFYSGTKAMAQQVLAPYLKTKSYLLRIRMPFGDQDHPKNFLTKMKRYDKLVSFDNSLSYLPDVARVSVDFAVKRPEPGIYNVCNPGHSNARKIVELMGLTKEFFTEEEFVAAVVAPRSNCVLNVDKLMKVCTIPGIEERLVKAIKDL